MRSRDARQHGLVDAGTRSARPAPAAILSPLSRTATSFPATAAGRAAALGSLISAASTSRPIPVLVRLRQTSTEVVRVHEPSRRQLHFKRLGAREGHAAATTCATARRFNPARCLRLRRGGPRARRTATVAGARREKRFSLLLVTSTATALDALTTAATRSATAAGTVLVIAARTTTGLPTSGAPSHVLIPYIRVT